MQGMQELVTTTSSLYRRLWRDPGAASNRHADYAAVICSGTGQPSHGPPTNEKINPFRRPSGHVSAREPWGTRMCGLPGPNRTIPDGNRPHGPDWNTADRSGPQRIKTDQTGTQRTKADQRDRAGPQRTKADRTVPQST